MSKGFIQGHEDNVMEMERIRSSNRGYGRDKYENYADNLYQRKKIYLQALSNIYPIRGDDNSSDINEVNQVLLDILSPYLNPWMIAQNLKGLIDLLREQGIARPLTFRHDR